MIWSSEANLGPGQTSESKLFAKIGDGWKPLSVFAKKKHLRSFLEKVLNALLVITQTIKILIKQSSKNQLFLNSIHHLGSNSRQYRHFCYSFIDARAWSWKKCFFKLLIFCCLHKIMFSLSFDINLAKLGPILGKMHYTHVILLEKVH